MSHVEAGRYTVGVFQDVAWAQKGLAALRQAGFPAESLTILAKAGPETEGLIAQTLGTSGESIDIARVGAVVGHGPMLGALQGETHDLPTAGIAGTMRRVGFQSHDGRIFETLTGRGGVLVAILSEPRAADALALLHSYGGGNAAIGAWTGRV